MKLSAKKLILELTEATNSVIQKAKEYQTLDEEQLIRNPDPGSWSILQCLEHLNLYGDFYLPEFENRILKAKERSGDYNFQSGILGNYSANSMLPKNGKVNKMKTFRDKDPMLLDLEKDVVFARFFKQQEKYLELLKMASKKDLNKTKTSTTIKFLSFKMGDTFRFVINHNLRHIWQADNVLKAIKTPKKEELIG